MSIVIFSLNVTSKSLQIFQNQSRNHQTGAGISKRPSEKHITYGAIDHEGTILDCYVSKRRNKKAAYKALKKLISRHGKPKEIVTDIANRF
ncbi:MAG: hypothetical protein COA45_12120 [Zetaproteobacteria bacterium]|nr:MAG: hypothetical protein COA45_12120 [Zetaproteobacteria bacterium]